MGFVGTTNETLRLHLSRPNTDEAERQHGLLAAFQHRFRCPCNKESVQRAKIQAMSVSASSRLRTFPFVQRD